MTLGRRPSKDFRAAFPPQSAGSAGCWISDLRPAAVGCPSLIHSYCVNDDLLPPAVQVLPDGFPASAGRVGLRLDFGMLGVVFPLTVVARPHYSRFLVSCSSWVKSPRSTTFLRASSSSSFSPSSSLSSSASHPLPRLAVAVAAVAVAVAVAVISPYTYAAEA